MLYLPGDCCNWLLWLLNRSLKTLSMSRSLLSSYSCIRGPRRNNIREDQGRFSYFFLCHFSYYFSYIISSSHGYNNWSGFGGLIKEWWFGKLISFILLQLRTHTDRTAHGRGNVDGLQMNMVAKENRMFVVYFVFVFLCYLEELLLHE